MISRGQLRYNNSENVASSDHSVLMINKGRFPANFQYLSPLQEVKFLLMENRVMEIDRNDEM